MVLKNPISLEKLKKVKISSYLRVLQEILKKKFLDGQTVPFLLILDHEYLGADAAKSAKCPLFLLGEFKGGWNKWKKFGEGVAKSDASKTQLNFMLGGTCTRQGDYLLLSFEKKYGIAKGPVVTNGIKALKKILKTINPNLTIGTKDSGEKEEVLAAGAAVGGDTKQDKNTDTKSKTAPDKKEKSKVSEEQKEKLVNKYKEEKQDEAKKLGEQFKELNTMSSSDSIKKVTANIKKGRTTKKDLKAVKALNKVFSTTEKLYKGTAKQVQKKFEKPYKELSKNKKKFYKLSLATKQSKKSLAETLASFYYEKKEDRVATKDEVKEIQKIIKDVILMNKKRRKKAKQTMLFQVTAEVLRKEGPKDFKAKSVNKILQEKLK